jgi:gliding motility-associated-like protein
MRKCALLIIVAPFLQLTAQTITPSVINSAGMHRVSASGVSITDNVGEPFVSTIGSGNFLITQGFLQPLKSTIGFSASIIKNNLVCTDKEEDAFISIAITSPPHSASYKADYLWSAPGKGKGRSRLDTLSPGAYQVTIAVTYTNTTGQVRFDTLRPAPIVIEQAASPCKITIYKGITPNNDGTNDIWQIDNIEQFPKNRVAVFNRWGIQIADIQGYDNRSKSFPTPDLLNKLPASTYFYVIELGDGTKPYKGWVELFKTN